MVTRNRDRVELGHVLGGVANDVANDLHRRLWRVDVGVAHHELFQNVVLNRSRQQLLAHALLFSRYHVASQHRQHRAVHGHRDRHFVQRNFVEQDLHVLDRVNGHTGLAHVARHTGMVRVVATVGGQVKRHRHTLTTCGQSLAVKRVGFFSGGEACVLANRPWAHRIHGGLWTAHIRLKAGQGVGVREVLGVFCGVQRLDADTV